MHIRQLNLHHVPPINGVNVDCDKRVNLFIGPNALGKSTILRAMEYVYYPSEDHPLSYIVYPTSRWKWAWGLQPEYAHYADGAGPYCWMPASKDWPHKNPQSIDGEPAYREPIWNRVPLLYIPATRINLPLNPKGWWNDELLESNNAPADKAKIQISFGIESSDDSVLFNAHNLKVDIDRLWFISHKEKHKRSQLDHTLRLGFSCAQSICNEVLTGHSAQTYIEETDDDIIYLDDMLAHPNMGVVTSDGIIGVPLYLGSLSSGTQGTLLWIWALALKMAIHYDFVEGWEKEPAILLIDEIENHLHPTWQRRVIPALLRHFPKLQIFATTHSPFVVAGLKAGQVHLLKRNKAGVVTADTNTEDIVGWTMDEVLRTMMGVIDPTDDVTARAAEELRRLRNQEPLSDEQAEERRQHRMRELRQRVNRDLLAGGPMAAQRERFEERFGKALEKYRQSQSLDQDRG